MSLTGLRQQLAAALSGVPDVTGHAYRPVAPNVGDAWPLQGPGDRDGGTAFLVTWRIRVLVPQDEVAASSWWDEHWPYLFEALAPMAHVVRFEPVLMPVSGVDQLAYEVTAITEE